MASGKPQQTVLVCTTNMFVATTDHPYLFCTWITHTHCTKTRTQWED